MVDYIEDNLKEIFVYLTNSQCPKNARIIKLHTKQMKNGDYSFPNSIKSWNAYFKCEQSNNLLRSKLDYSLEHPEKFISELVNESEAWTFKINNVSLIQDRYFVHLKRDLAFKIGINAVLKYKDVYGFSSHDAIKSVHVSGLQQLSSSTLTGLRLNIAIDVCNNFLKTIGHVVSDSPSDADLNLHFINNHIKDATNDNRKLVLCGIVTPLGNIKSTVLATEFQSKRSNQMQLLAQHKYGIRFTDSSKSLSLCQELGKYAVIFEMLQVKLSKPLSVDLENHTSCSTKGVSFILYNYARISSVRDEFEKKVLSGYYPELPDFENIDCSLYKDDMEWELLFCYILKFPMIVKECCQDILEGVFNPHYLCHFLSGLVGVFSVYYRNVKFLVTGHEHMVPVIHARMYLLIALDYVLRNGLALLSISPFKTM